MELYYDLHIHSALSPCGDEDMTPNNIANMAALIGLDLIAVCDHNSCDNLPAVEKAAKAAGVMLLPGIELTTAEEVHLLGYFPDVESAVAFGTEIYRALPDIPNNESFFGRQLVMDENDCITGKKDKLLISSLPYGIIECCEIISNYGGVAVPAHINKSSNSILGNLGFFPADVCFGAVEVWRPEPVTADISSFTQIFDSDAHSLDQISERENFILVDSPYKNDILKFLSANRIIKC